MRSSLALCVVLGVCAGCSRTEHPIASSKPLDVDLRTLQALVSEKLAQLESAIELAAKGKGDRVSEALGEIMVDVTPAVNELIRDAAGTQVENDAQQVRADAERLAEVSKRWNRSPVELQTGFNSLQNRLATVSEKANAY